MQSDSDSAPRGDSVSNGRFDRNVGGFDRVVRGGLGVGLVVGALAAFLTDRRSTAAVAALAGAGLLFNAVTCFCGANAVLGIDTTASEE